MKNNTGLTGGFVFLAIILFIGVIIAAGLFYYMFKINPIVVSPTEEKPREFITETSPTPTNPNQAITPGATASKSDLTPTPVQSAFQKNILKISSFGNVDLGGGFTANLTSAWEINNMINTQVVLKNNYNSLLGVNTGEFTLHGKGVITKPTTPAKEMGLEPGDTTTILLIFKKIPNPPYTLQYDNPGSHLVFDIGNIYPE